MLVFAECLPRRKAQIFFSDGTQIKTSLLLYPNVQFAVPFSYRSKVGVSASFGSLLFLGQENTYALNVGFGVGGLPATLPSPGVVLPAQPIAFDNHGVIQTFPLGASPTPAHAVADVAPFPAEPESTTKD